MTSSADITAKFYNLLAEKTMANVVALTSAAYDEINTSLAAIDSGTTRPIEKDR